MLARETPFGRRPLTNGGQRSRNAVSSQSPTNENATGSTACILLFRNPSNQRRGTREIVPRHDGRHRSLLRPDWLMIGQTLAHYEILGPLGEGGMGVVYKARDTRLGRLVAIKVLPSEANTNPDGKRRFVREAKAASALNHPNIITIYGIDHAADVDFIAMEYVTGTPLNQLIPTAGLRLATALRYAVQVADALAAAHAAGIVHRDLKPSNVMVTDDRSGQGARLRHCKADGPDAGRRLGRREHRDGAVIVPHRGGHRSGHDRLHVAGAGRRPGGRCALGHLQLRFRAVRDAQRPQGVRRASRSSLP